VQQAGGRLIKESNWPCKGHHAGHGQPAWHAAVRWL